MKILEILFLDSFLLNLISNDSKEKEADVKNYFRVVAVLNINSKTKQIIGPKCFNMLFQQKNIAEDERVNQLYDYFYMKAPNYEENSPMNGASNSNSVKYFKLYLSNDTYFCLFFMEVFFKHIFDTIVCFLENMINFKFAEKELQILKLSFDQHEKFYIQILRSEIKPEFLKLNVDIEVILNGFILIVFEKNFCFFPGEEDLNFVSEKIKYLNAISDFFSKSKHLQKKHIEIKSEYLDEEYLDNIQILESYSNSGKRKIPDDFANKASNSNKSLKNHNGQSAPSNNNSYLKSPVTPQNSRHINKLRTPSNSKPQQNRLTPASNGDSGSYNARLTSSTSPLEQLSQRSRPKYDTSTIKQHSKVATSKIFLNCPFSEKESCKVLGGKWDPEKKKWYAPPGEIVEKFRKWLQ
ncbi:hypothetical protein HDU92_003034 [Lobulomyces angularis]|nr:hypothetical protein HDU92_003034 [Lobulomyces angularis]